MNCHYRFYDLEYFFQEASNNGFKYCEIWTSPHHFAVNSYECENPQKLVDLANKYEIEIIAICPEQTNPKPHNIATPFIDQQERVYQYFKNVIDVSSYVGANKVVITTGWCFYDEDSGQAYLRSVKMMKKICNYALEKGVVMALEALQPDESLLVNSAKELSNYIEDVNVDSLKVCIDMGAMARANETINDYFDLFGESIVHVHFVDGHPTGHLAWGDGYRDIQQDLIDFKENNYSGFLSLETASDRYFEIPSETDKRSMNQFLENGGEN